MTLVKIKRTKGTKRCVMKRKLKFENYKSCLEVTQLSRKINHLEKNKINMHGLKTIIKSS